jgi:hypothetical protein
MLLASFNRLSYPVCCYCFYVVVVVDDVFVATVTATRLYHTAFIWIVQCSRTFDKPADEDLSRLLEEQQ